MDRFFFYRGVVVKGDQRGRLLGFPTANLKLENKLALPHGVYATWAVSDRGGRDRIPSVTNVGVRPTFSDRPEGDGLLPVIVECHLILPEGESIDLYGETLEVQFVERFRDERKFSSFDDLKAQILLDKERAREFFRLREDSVNKLPS
jgi:riboflavin kinase/FMN adenylyltransferase